MSSDYGKVITKLREQANLTQKAVADRLGVTVQTISNWETGTRVPRLEPRKTLLLCSILNCSLEELADIDSNTQ